MTPPPTDSGAAGDRPARRGEPRSEVAADSASTSLLQRLKPP